MWRWSDPAEAQVFKVVNIGKTVSFSSAGAQLDQSSNWHLLCRRGGAFHLMRCNYRTANCAQESSDYCAPGRVRRPQHCGRRHGRRYMRVRRLHRNPCPIGESPRRFFRPPAVAVKGAASRSSASNEVTSAGIFSRQLDRAVVRHLLRSRQKTESSRRRTAHRLPFGRRKRHVTDDAPWLQAPK